MFPSHLCGSCTVDANPRCLFLFLLLINEHVTGKKTRVFSQSIGVSFLDISLCHPSSASDA
jgi:hypothetical protein